MLIICDFSEKMSPPKKTRKDLLGELVDVGTHKSISDDQPVVRKHLADIINKREAEAVAPPEAPRAYLRFRQLFTDVTFSGNVEHKDFAVWASPECCPITKECVLRTKDRAGIKSALWIQQKGATLINKFDTYFLTYFTGELIAADAGYLVLTFSNGISKPLMMPATSIIWDIIRMILRTLGQETADLRMVFDGDRLAHSIVLNIEIKKGEGDLMLDAFNTILVIWPVLLKLGIDENIHHSPSRVGAVMNMGVDRIAASTSIEDWKNEVLEVITSSPSSTKHWRAGKRFFQGTAEKLPGFNTTLIDRAAFVVGALKSLHDTHQLRKDIWGMFSPPADPEGPAASEVMQE